MHALVVRAEHGLGIEAGLAGGRRAVVLGPRNVLKPPALLVPFAEDLDALLKDRRALGDLGRIQELGLKVLEQGLHQLRALALAPSARSHQALRCVKGSGEERRGFVLEERFTA